MSMEALERCGASNGRAAREIRTFLQSLVARSRATRGTGGASFDMKSGARGKHLTLILISRLARTLTACASLAVNRRQSVLRDFSLRQDQVFPWRDRGGGTLRTLISAATTSNVGAPAKH
jgi:hypothetical protein